MKLWFLLDFREKDLRYERLQHLRARLNAGQEAA